MTATPRGADLLARGLREAGVRRLFTLSGNQIMAVFDAALDAGLELVHVRHEAAAVHMADAWGRLTGEVGVALLPAGPGHLNGVSAIYTARTCESPVVVLSGHAPLGNLGRGAFQEIRQADVAAPVAKAAWTVSDAAHVGADLARAVRIALGARPGPVSVSLPQDVLTATPHAGRVASPRPEDFVPGVEPVDDDDVRAVLERLREAERPLVLASPAMARGRARETADALAARAGVPVIAMESPRGINDPALGAFAEVLAGADLIVLLGKQPDFMIGFGDSPVVDPACRFVCVAPEPNAADEAARSLGASERLLCTVVADPRVFVERMLALAPREDGPGSGWLAEASAALAHRPAQWSEIRSNGDGRVHPIEVCRAVQRVLDADPESVLVLDGGEYGQWAQAGLRARRRLVNGPGGAIGSALPCAIAARFATPACTPVIAVLGDGTFGFHLAEIDTAVRHALPFVAVVGNDARWNAEHQIQLRSFGPNRLVGCDLLPTRYDRVAEALGAHGEHVARADELGGALARALASGRPAVVDVAIESTPAPVIRR